MTIRHILHIMLEETSPMKLLQFTNVNMH